MTSTPLEKNKQFKNNIFTRRSFIKLAGAGVLLGTVTTSAVGFKNTFDLQLTEYVLEIPHLHPSFDGYKICHLSDIHNTEAFVEDGKDLISETVQHLEPNSIAITGDLLDSNHTDVNIAKTYLKNLLKTAPVFLVSGNHETRYQKVFYESDSQGNFSDEPTFISLKDLLWKDFSELGVRVLDLYGYGYQAISLLDNSKNALAICGIRDIHNTNHRKYIHMLSKLAKETEHFKTRVLLTHRPELFELYEQYGFNIILAGHTHGGQIRLFGKKAIFAPNQGFFPKYDYGHYSRNNLLCQMIISQGLGQSTLPIRLGTTPEIVLITLTPR